MMSSRMKHGVMLVPLIASLLLGPSGVHAQGTVHPDTPTDTAVSAAGITSLGYAYATNLLPMTDWGIYPIVNGHVVLQRDSVKTVVDSMTRAWIAALAHRGAPHRIELLSSAELHWHVGQDAEAQQCFATWLATPGLSDTAKAWILGKAIELFLGLRSAQNPEDPPPPPARLTIVRHYLTQLAALPRAVSAGRLFVSYQETMGVYMKFGMVDSALAYGLRAYTLPAQTESYYTRLGMVTNVQALLTFALALSAYPERYQHTMDSVITMLHGYAMVPTPPDFAKYPWNVRFVKASQNNLDVAIKLVQTLGRPAPTLIATHWFNQPTPTAPSDAAPGARIKPLNDGVVRIIGFGYFGCMGCQLLMKEWERFQHKLPAGAQLLFYERSSGFWGGDLVEPDEEATHLRHYYVERKHYTYPIVVWAGAKEANDEGGRTPKFSPTMQAYGFYGGPHVVVVDGNGILRYRRDGAGQPELLGVVTQLLREHQHTKMSSTPSSATVGSSDGTAHTTARSTARSLTSTDTPSLSPQ